MGINKYFTEAIDIYEKTRTKVRGVLNEELVLVESTVGAIDKFRTAYQFTSDKQSFNYTDTVFLPIGTTVVEDNVLTIDSKNYEVISVVDPMRRAHHLEVYVNRLE